MNIYRITVKHDKGRENFVITAKNIQAAINILIIAEGYPERAITNIKVIKTGN